jgi:hypothetical protein
MNDEDRDKADADFDPCQGETEQEMASEEADDLHSFCFVSKNQHGSPAEAAGGEVIAQRRRGAEVCV